MRHEDCTFQASDADGDTISYSINGQDAGAFSSGQRRIARIFRIKNLAGIVRDCVTAMMRGHGVNMVLMGNSFFRPYAQELGEMALAAGFTEHRDTGVFAGGDNGRPTNLWQANNALTAEIKTALDAGDVDMP